MEVKERCVPLQSRLKRSTSERGAGNENERKKIIEKIEGSTRSKYQEQRTRALIPRGKKGRAGEIRKYTTKSLILAQDER